MNIIDESFPKFQYSVFDKNGFDSQWVVRGNDWTQFLLDVEAIRNQVKGHMKAEEPKKEVDLSINGTTGQGGFCPVHNADLEWKSGISKKNNKPYGFWACPMKLSDGSFCQAGSQRKS